MHQSEHGLSATIQPRTGEPLCVSGPSPYIDTTEPLPAYCGVLPTPNGWWGIVTHCPRGTHPQDAVQHFEGQPANIHWCGYNATIGLFRLFNRDLIVSARIREPGVLEMKSVIASTTDRDFADSRFEKRRVPAGIRYLPGRHLQLWFEI